jgi:peptidoglycan/LPS O-acetylase OafA/YrhL
MFRRRLKKPLQPKTILALAVIIGVCLLEIIGQNGQISRATGIALSPLPAIFAWSLAMACIVLSYQYSERPTPRSKVGQIIVKWTGRMTYPLYLMHHLVVMSAAVLLSPYVGLGSILVGFVLAYLTAALIEAGPERTLRRALAAGLERAQARIMPVAGALLSIRAGRNRTRPRLQAE